MTFNLFSLSIVELDKKLFLLFDILSQKIVKCNDKTNDDTLLYCNNVSKFIFYYFSNKIIEDPSIYINIFEIVSILLSSFTEIKLKYSEDEYKTNITQSLNILFTIFKNVDINIAKQCAAKIFNFLLVQDNYYFIKYIFDMIRTSLLDFSDLENFDKFFVFYFMKLQFLSKKTNDIIIITKQINEMKEDNEDRQEKVKVKTNLIEIVENITTYVIQFFFVYIEKTKVSLNKYINNYNFPINIMLFILLLSILDDQSYFQKLSLSLFLQQ